MHSFVLLLTPLAAGSEMTPDVEAAVAVAWAWKVPTPEPPPPVVTRTPSAYETVLARVRAGESLTFAAPLDGFPGSPGVYDAYPINGKPYMKRREVSRPATPFPAAESRSTPTTGVTSAGTSRRPAPAPGSFAATPPAVTYTIAPTAGRGGNTNCPPWG